ncbi:putative serine/threonine-protein kinase [Dendrobium catenatum]|uniref:PTI1-like tyrosine-protein kinase n=1 Tax=Dendrobium catenatum TaxID=906689 RepID=A0A2I0W0C2_9ASPA|nr:putative serine/threonine-protein kinase [Dendrobium catenatum]PKU69112.1 PTI1-like tyrosine-protein kinase [Dendrobium catenatum]
MGSNTSICCGSKTKKQFVSGGEQSSTWRLFTYKELHAATNGFSEEYKLGEGGFGTVYWGKTTDGHQIAVKKLKTINSKAEMEFAVEVEILGRVRHKNLLGLRGYCAGANQRLIVYDYMPNLSLLSHLHGQFTGEMRLNWKKRINIIMGSAEALVYLHHEVTPHIIHRDIKASNVLLDSNFEPLVADFGFAKLIPEGVSHMTTRVKGTLGYLAPEYAMWGKVSESCDVYSFGILLLEIVTGRKPIERLPGGVKRTITEWVDPFIATDQLSNLVDHRLQGQYDDFQLRRILHAAARCVQSEPDRRPSMRKVLAILQGNAAAADPVKNRKLADDFAEKDASSQAISDVVAPGMIRIKSVKYQEELMAMDDEGGEEGEEDLELTRSGSDGASVYGVFGAIEVQRVSHGYGQQVVSRRTALRG